MGDRSFCCPHFPDSEVPHLLFRDKQLAPGMVAGSGLLSRVVHICITGHARSFLEKSSTKQRIVTCGEYLGNGN